MMKFKKLIYEILFDSGDKRGFIYKIDDMFIPTLIILNVIAIFLESIPPISKEYHQLFHLFDVFSVIVFSIEYLLRLFVADFVYPNLSRFKAVIKYMRSPLGVIDLLAILPFYVPFFIELDLRILRIFRLFRIVRLLKLGHYVSSFNLIMKVIKNKSSELLVTLSIALVILFLTSILMFNIEYEAQPDKFQSIFHALWWSVATLTTIGYGDIFPITPYGQVLAAITAIFGIGLIAIPTSIISMGFLDELSNIKKKKEEKEEIEEVKENYKYCPHCGKKL